MKFIVEVWAKDNKIDTKQLQWCGYFSLYPLENHKVDAILQVGVKDDSYLYNELKFPEQSRR